MTFNAEQLAAIESAIASGELTVSSNGRHVTYRSVDDLIKARDMIRASLQQAGSIPKTKRFSYISRGNK